MNFVSAQEIKRRGLSAVDEGLSEGAVHVIKNNQLRYVVLSEADYAELLDAQAEAEVGRIRASLEDAEAGQVTRHDSVEALMTHLGL